MFPTTRLRRLRRHPGLRELVRETALSPAQFIQPLFVRHGGGERTPISSMPGQFQLPVEHLAKEANEIARLGIPGVILFGIPAHKDETGSDGYSREGIVQQGIRAIKQAQPELLVITDVCCCEYTSHGHCGVVNDHTGTPDVDNDATLELLGRQAVSHAQAGADVVAPSGMMDGMVTAIRTALDEVDFTHIPILSYAAKYSSAFYGPFREAADSAPQFGNRASYQMDPANGREALREVDQDVLEGADLLMVKPALSYLDVIRRVKDRWPEIPLAAYNVSGEYAMLKAASSHGWLDEKRVTLEVLTSIRRAGADMILTYHAQDAARWLAE